MRPIPNTVPDEIAELIYKEWGDMKAFASAIGEPYSSVHSVLCRRNRLKAAEQLINLSEIGLAGSLSPSTSADDLAEMMLIPDLKERALRLDKVLNGMSRNLWSVKAGIANGYFRSRLTYLDQSQLSTLMAIVEGLRLSLRQFYHIYKQHRRQAA